MQIVTASNFKEEVQESEIPVLMDFWADWCGPCRMIAPILEDLEVELAGKLKIVKINADQEIDLIYMYDITSIPTLILHKDGKVLHRMKGAMPKPALLKELEPFITL